MVTRLAKPGDQIVAELTPESAHMLHMMMGIAGEIGEMMAAESKEQFIEECGDVEFYLEGFRQGLNVTRDQVLAYLENVEGQLAANDLILFTASLVDTVKKCAFYQIPVDKIQEKILIALCGIESCLDYLRAGLEVTREEVLAGNIEKLSKRYNGFEYSDDAAVKRVDKAEVDEEKVL